MLYINYPAVARQERSLGKTEEPMKTPLILLAVVAGLALSPLAIRKVQSLSGREQTQIRVNESYKQQALPAANDALADNLPKRIDVKKTIVLEEQNSVLLKGPVTEESVGAVMKKLQAVSHRVSKDTPIYLVLDTPGGSIDAGLQLIDFAKALPQKIHTVTLFAASMGFQIAQGLDTRYITRTGTSMSHRARAEGLGGQVKGELESRYKMLRREVDLLDVIASERLGLDLKSYEEKIYNEMWVYGFDAINEKVADEVVLVNCGESLNGSFVEVYDTLFGQVNVTFSKCPLIKAPEKVELAQVAPENKDTVETALRMSFSNEEKFVKDYIVTDKFYTIFK